MKMTPRQELATTSINGLDNALERFSEALLTASLDDPGTTPPTKLRSHSGRRWKKELSHEDRIEQKLDRIIKLLENIGK